MQLSLLEQLKNRMGKQDKLLAKGTSVALVGVFGHMAMGLLLIVFKGRVLVEDDLGLIFLASSVAVTTFFLATSLHVTMIRYGSMFRGEGSLEKMKGVAIAIYKMGLPITVSLLLLLNLMAPFIAGLLKKPELTPFIRFFSVSAFFQSLWAINVGLLKVKYLVKYEYIALIIQTLLIGLFSLTAMIFIPLDQMVYAFAIAYMAAPLFVFFYTCTAVRKHFGFLFDRRVVPQPHGSRLLRYTLFTSASATLSKSRDEINTFLIGFFLLKADVALYGVAFKAAFLPIIITPAVNAIFTPMVSNFFGKGDIASIKRLQIKVTVLVAGFSVTMLLLYLVAAEQVLGIVGPNYVAVRSVLLVLALGNVATAVAGPTGFAISMMGRPQYNTVNALILLILMAGTCYYLIPIKGLIGAAIGYAISNSVICLLCMVEIAWIYRMEARKATAA